ncbi:MAG: 50S ribosomal protein L23 [Gemmatimonadota bacterium]|nr:50S ribosomal protein L23 [Gemmatimonadota bacterium]MDE2783254.1 50S ribosomal protein L23 [Gemmatimonadota bacterium]MDE2863646.1 50S ribosomal protein L23 [Gemmatimonadota bacterium]MXX56327.1 50S ribosomal protein L23 [Gemmatimonadota bacterium]MXX71054.1 50S ribosomal protein L23 [Gemmatimonadota bacterium]
MREAYDVIVSPVITEKTTEQMEASLYTFVVNERANKHEIARAVEALWDVKVEDVRTMRYPGKAKRALLGRMAKNWNLGRRASYKKAVVQLVQGDEIEFYEMG